MAQHSLANFLNSPLSQDESACVYSALILVDDDLPITEDKIKTILKAANVEVEPIWPSLFAKALSVSIKESESFLGVPCFAHGFSPDHVFFQTSHLPFLANS